MMRNPLEVLYNAGSAAKNFLYDKNVLKSVKIQSSVISIGNLSFGGTGKTPCIEFLANELSTVFKIAIVCKSYKAKATKPMKVDLSLNDKAAIYGDEACLLQQKLPQCSVWSGPQKYATAEATQILSPDLVLVDDGFSHRQLQRDFDLVLIDVSQNNKDYLRESLASLARAHAIILTKSDEVSPEQLAFAKEKILRAAGHLEHAIFSARSETIFDLKNEDELMVFCGIAKPDSFKQSILRKPYRINKFISFSDHYAYTAAQQEALYQQYLLLKKINSKLRLLTTEKDFVKLTHPQLLSEISVARHKMILTDTDKVGLLEKIRASL